jgi:hypothetical protein
MSVIETMTFRLAAPTEEAPFLAADRRLQTEFAYHQAGLVRRTTARSHGGDWIVVDLWASEADADASTERWNGDPTAAAFMALVDETTVRVQRYTTLD